MVADESTNILSGVPHGGATTDEDVVRVGWGAEGDGQLSADAGVSLHSEVLPVRESTAASPSALLLALQLGVLSGVMVAMLASVHVAAVHESALAWRLLAAGAALLSAWGLARHARSLFTVLERAALLGALEWLAMALFGAPRALPQALAITGPAGEIGEPLAVGVLTSGQPPELFTGPLALVMAAACVLGWLFVGRLHREWAQDEPALRR